VGAFWVSHAEAVPFEAAQLLELDDLADWAEALLAGWQLGSDRQALERVLDEVCHDLGLDSELGVLSTSALSHRCVREVARARRCGTDLSVLRITLGGTGLGQAADGACMRSLVEAMRGVLRPYDELGRLGQQELAVLMPAADAAEAASTAMRLRQQLGLALLPGVTVQRDLLVGAASLREFDRGGDAGDLLERAGRALDQARTQAGAAFATPGRPPRNLPWAWSAEWGPLEDH
jgi:GGDEF domain-containing protein